jgi:hypothetical protein
MSNDKNMAVMDSEDIEANPPADKCQLVCLRQNSGRKRNRI